MRFAVVVLLAVLIVAVQPSVAAHAASSVSAVVSIAPQRTFVEKIAGERVGVQVMVAPGASPATYEPSPRQMAGLADADVYFAIGVPYERAWLPRFAEANPAMRIVHTDDGIDKVPMADHGHHDHGDHGHGHGHGEEHAKEADHGHGHGHGHAEEAHGNGEDHGHHDHGDHGHGGFLDPHIWLSPPLVKQQAAAIRDGLAAVDPAGSAVYEAGYQAFAAEIDALDSEIEVLLDGLEGRRFMVFHPSWGYFAREYGLEQIAIEAAGKEPGPRELARFIDKAREAEIEVIFIQPQFSRQAAETIGREAGARVETLDPLAEDWAANLRRVARTLALELR
jgi:zinc transport system substrate-binding protein